MKHLSFKFLIALCTATFFLSALNGCAGNPKVATRSALDGKPDPFDPNSQSASQTPPENPKPNTDSQVPNNSSSSTTNPSNFMQLVADKVQPQVTISTKFGDIVIALDDKAAPKTAANFEKLVRSGFYDGTTFHRIIPGFMIQGGDPNSKGTDRSQDGIGGPGYTIPAEIGLKHTRGAVAMARLGDEVNPQKESSGSQFFICVVATPFLDNNYTVFGHVIQGMDVVDKIVQQPRDARDDPNERIEMKVRLSADPAVGQKST